MTNVDKEKVVDYLRELADVEYQRTVWFASSGEVSSLVEATCNLFDDSGLAIAFERGEIVFSLEIDALLRKLSEALNLVDGYQQPKKIIMDPAMIPVRKLAGDILYSLFLKGTSR